MSKINYNFVKNENELQDKINNLDKVANSYLMEIKDLYMEDLFSVCFR